MISFFHRIGFWQREDESTVRGTSIKILYSIYYLLCSVSLIAGAISSDNKDESIFLTESAIMGVVVSVKLFYITWEKKQIIELLRRIGVYSIEAEENFTLVNKKLRNFMNIVTVVLCYIYFGVASSGFVAPFIGKERKLFFNIGFPFDYKNNEIAFWIAYAFVCSEIVLAEFVFLLSVIIWFLLINCSVQYEVLGNRIRNMGAVKSERKISQREKQNLFFVELIKVVKSHQQIKA